MLKFNLNKFKTFNRYLQKCYIIGVEKFFGKELLAQNLIADFITSNDDDFVILYFGEGENFKEKVTQIISKENPQKTKEVDKIFVYDNLNLDFIEKEAKKISQEKQVILIADLQKINLEPTENDIYLKTLKIISRIEKLYYKYKTLGFLLLDLKEKEGIIDLYFDRPKKEFIDTMHNAYVIRFKNIYNSLEKVTKEDIHAINKIILKDLSEISNYITVYFIKKTKDNIPSNIIKEPSYKDYIVLNTDKTVKNLETMILS